MGTSISLRKSNHVSNITGNVTILYRQCNSCIPHGNCNQWNRENWMINPNKKSKVAAINDNDNDRHFMEQSRDPTDRLNRKQQNC